MRSLALCLLLAACSGTPPPTHAGVDAGTGADAGAQCTGVPSRITREYTCVGLGEPGAARCTEATLEAAVTAHFRNDCDAGPGVFGHLSVGECGGGVRAVRWVYGPIGDTYECFYDMDGGVLIGAINYGERALFVSGQVGDCTTEPPSMCRDGG